MAKDKNFSMKDESSKPTPKIVAGQLLCLKCGKPAINPKNPSKPFCEYCKTTVLGCDGN